MRGHQRKWSRGQWSRTLTWGRAAPLGWAGGSHTPQLTREAASRDAIVCLKNWLLRCASITMMGLSQVTFALPFSSLLGWPAEQNVLKGRNGESLLPSLNTRTFRGPEIATASGLQLSTSPRGQPANETKGPTCKKSLRVRP